MIKLKNYKKRMRKKGRFATSENEKAIQLMSIKEVYGQLKNGLENATYELKREILQDLVEKVVKTDDKLENRVPNTPKRRKWPGATVGL